MLRNPVSSSNLRSVGYDEQNYVLEIEFNSSSIYQYFQVPFQIYADLINAPSHGSYFAAHIKNSYSYRRIA